MIFKKFDYLSPNVTFYYKGYLSHSSIFSGILSIFSFILIIIIAIYFSLDIIQREHPTAFYFNRFEEDAGTFPLNSSSFFHFISLSIDSKEIGDEGVDFQSFRIIGLETYYQIYANDKNLSKFDHWVYGYCNKEKDTGNISDLVNYNFFQNSACIRKYFNSNEQQYYDTWDPQFRWPVIAHGTYNSDNKFYCIILERCEEETINLILNGNNHCKSNDEINKIIGFNSAAHLFYIDNYIDVLNYDNPYTKFFYRIENAVQANSYPINHLNFNPSLIKTHNGLIFDHINTELSYSYERNDVFTYNDNNKTYTVYYLWLNNRINYYERNYKRIQDVFSNIGGIFQFVIFIAIFINGLYNKYIVLFDTENLLNSSIDYEKRYYINRRMNYSKKLQNFNKSKNITSEKRINNQETSINKTLHNINDRDISKSNNFSKTDIGYEINNNKKTLKFKKKDEDNSDNDKDNKKINHNFWNYVLFKLSFEKKEISFKLYQNFRTKIISEEHLIRNHLNIYNLLKVNQKKINSNRRYSYKLKDLIKLV